MSGYIGYRDGGKTSEQGLKEELNRLFTAGVSIGDTATSLQVTQRGAGANMSVDIAIGDAHLVRPDAAYSYWGWTDAVTNQAIAAADPTNPRIDAIVAYLDPSVVSSASNNNIGAFKFSSISGTPAGSPVAPTNSAIQAALGANFPWIPLAQVAVAANATTIVNANITDVRVAIASKVSLSASRFTNPYKFSVYRNAGQSIGATTTTPVQFNVKDYDTGINFDATTNFRFTAPIAGFYHFTAYLAMNSGGTGEGFVLSIVKNTSVTVAADTVYSVPNASATTTLSISKTIQLSASDLIQVNIFNSVGAVRGVLPGIDQTFLTGYLVSAT